MTKAKLRRRRDALAAYLEDFENWRLTPKAEL